MTEIITKTEEGQDAQDARQNRRESQGPEFAAEEGLGKKHGVEVEWAVVIRGVIFVVTSGSHLVGEPAIDPLIEVGGLDLDQPHAQKNCNEQDGNLWKVGFEGLEIHPHGISAGRSAIKPEATPLDASLAPGTLQRNDRSHA